MFTFGWLTITAEDLALWVKYPNAAFTLYSTAKAPEPSGDAEMPAGEEFRLGTFELRSDSNYSESEKWRLRTAFLFVIADETLFPQVELKAQSVSYFFNAPLIANRIAGRRNHRRLPPVSVIFANADRYLADAQRGDDHFG
jgi:hypothetical protein